MVKVIIPKIYVVNMDTPIIFLAGPIGSAPNWQDEAIKLINSKNPDLYVASPRKEIGPEIKNMLLRETTVFFQDPVNGKGIT